LKIDQNVKQKNEKIIPKNEKNFSEKDKNEKEHFDNFLNKKINIKL